MFKKESPTVRLVRWRGNEYQYNEGDVEFVHEIMAHHLGIKRATMFTTTQTGQTSWRCVILDIGNMNLDDPSTGNRLSELQMEAEQDPDRQCFLVELTREAYAKLKKDRARNKNNVFDLHLGYYEDEADPA